MTNSTLKSGSLTHQTPQSNQTAEDKLNHPGSEVSLPFGFGPVPADNEKVFFFDIDNCLYNASHKINELMQVYIRRYIRTHLQLNEEDAQELHYKYYKEYGLAIQGLVLLHKIDALEYNKEVDDSLPLHEILKPDLELRNIILRLRAAGKVKRFWLFTNAYKTHGLRVIKLLGIGDLFDGMTFCDYGKQEKFICKPDPRAFHKALSDAGVQDPSNAYFVDDSPKNCTSAVELGFAKVVNVVESASHVAPKGSLQIKTIHDLPNAVPELFK